MRVHDTAHDAITSTGGSIAAGLRDAVLGSRTTGPGATPPVGAPVGSASAGSATGVPGVIQNAMANLQSNSQAQTLSQILNQVLHGIGNGNQPSPQQNALFQAQTEQINQNMNTQAQPGLIQQQISALQQKQANAAAAQGPLANQMAPIGTEAQTPQQNYDNQLQQNLYSNLSNAKNASANGWISQPYGDSASYANNVINQGRALWNANRVTY